jgi:hypothetical protein
MECHYEYKNGGYRWPNYLVLADNIPNVIAGQILELLADNTPKVIAGQKNHLQFTLLNLQKWYQLYHQ